MPDPKGDKLFVNLAASQTRRRLKGFGHGVRKVHSAGRNQAVVVHTAKGRHLAELEAKFADVGFSLTESLLGETLAPRPQVEMFEGASGSLIPQTLRTLAEEGSRNPMQDAPRHLIHDVLRDPVQEASEDSFPASDAPARTGVTRS